MFDQRFQNDISRATNPANPATIVDAPSRELMSSDVYVPSPASYQYAFKLLESVSNLGLPSD